MKNISEAVTRPISILGRSLLMTGHPSDGYYNHITEEAMADADILALASLLLPPNGVILDVGANIGYESIFFSGLVPKGRVFAFEPVPSNVELIKHNLSQNDAQNVTLLPYGLGKSNTSATIMYREDNRGGASVKVDKAEAKLYDVAEDIEVKVLDELIANKQLAIRRCDLLKVDIEGFELEFLSGASSFIAKYKPPMIIEANHWCLDGLHGITMAEFLAAIEDMYPYVAAFDGNQWIDVRKERLRFMHDNMVFRRFQNLFCDFNQKRWTQAMAQHQWGWSRLVDYDQATKDLSWNVRQLETAVAVLEREKAELQVKYDRITNTRTYRMAKKVHGAVRHR